MVAKLQQFQIALGQIGIPQVHRALFWAESRKGGKLTNFLGDFRADDVFRIAIV